MKALIWDLDGTLNDSYPRMVDCLYRVCKDFFIDTDKASINQYITQYSIGEWLSEYETNRDLMHAAFQAYLEESEIPVPLIKDALAALQWGKEHGYAQFIYTHSPSTIKQRLESLQITSFFTEVITIDNGFAPKPNPQAYHYLNDKYHFDTAYYIGDRTLDMDFAVNSGIKGVLYLPKNSYVIPNGNESYIIDSLKQLSIIEGK